MTCRRRFRSGRLPDGVLGWEPSSFPQLRSRRTGLCFIPISGESSCAALGLEAPQR